MKTKETIEGIEGRWADGDGEERDWAVRKSRADDRGDGLGGTHTFSQILLLAVMFAGWPEIMKGNLEY